MYSNIILKDFVQFTEKSAAAMMSQLPASSAIAATPMAASADEGTRSPALVSPTTMAQSMPRVAAMPTEHNSNHPEPKAPKPVTDTSKPLKTTKF